MSPLFDGDITEGMKVCWATEVNGDPVLEPCPYRISRTYAPGDIGVCSKHDSTCFYHVAKNAERERRVILGLHPTKPLGKLGITCVCGITLNSGDMPYYDICPYCNAPLDATEPPINTCNNCGNRSGPICCDCDGTEGQTEVSPNGYCKNWKLL